MENVCNVVFSKRKAPKFYIKWSHLCKYIMVCVWTQKENLERCPGKCSLWLFLRSRSKLTSFQVFYKDHALFLYIPKTIYSWKQTHLCMLVGRHTAEAHSWLSVTRAGVRTVTAPHTHLPHGGPSATPREITGWHLQGLGLSSASFGTPPRRKWIKKGKLSKIQPHSPTSLEPSQELFNPMIICKLHWNVPETVKWIQDIKWGILELKTHSAI